MCRAEGAVDTLLDVFQRLDREKPIAPSRSPRHARQFHERGRAQPDAAQWASSWTLQPGWLHFDVPALEASIRRLENMRYFFPLRSYIDRGIVVAGGSDHMIGHDKNGAVNAFNPFFNMWASITRRTREGEVIYPQEKITRQEALKMWTIWAAYLQFGEKTRGSIEPGQVRRSGCHRPRLPELCGRRHPPDRTGRHHRKWASGSGRL